MLMGLWLLYQSLLFFALRIYGAMATAFFSGETNARFWTPICFLTIQCMYSITFLVDPIDIDAYGTLATVPKFALFCRRATYVSTCFLTKKGICCPSYGFAAVCSLNPSARAVRQLNQHHHLLISLIRGDMDPQFRETSHRRLLPSA